MSLGVPPHCPHELRPGTVTCLYCARDAREASRVRLTRFLGRAVAAGAVGLVIIAGGSELLIKLRARALATSAEAAVVIAAAAPTESAGLAAERTDSSPEENTASPTPPSAIASLRVREGRTELGEGMYALRTGAHVVVHFDELMLRTRRPEKFERIVRHTLPRIHGALADSLLALVVPGQLTSGGDLLMDLPARGIHLPADGAPLLSLFPELRPGRDGPLVVAYRVTPGR